MKIWECKIGQVADELVPEGGDHPMRQAVYEAYVKVTGKEPNFNFSGWGAKLTKIEQEVIEHQTKIAKELSCESD